MNTLIYKLTIYNEVDEDFDKRLVRQRIKDQDINRYTIFNKYYLHRTDNSLIVDENGNEVPFQIGFINSNTVDYYFHTSINSKETKTFYLYVDYETTLNDYDIKMNEKVSFVFIPTYLLFNNRLSTKVDGYISDINNEVSTDFKYLGQSYVYVHHWITVNASGIQYVYDKYAYRDLHSFNAYLSSDTDLTNYSLYSKTFTPLNYSSSHFTFDDVNQKFIATHVYIHNESFVCAYFKSYLLNNYYIAQEDPIKTFLEQDVEKILFDPFSYTLNQHHYTFQFKKPDFVNSNINNYAYEYYDIIPIDNFTLTNETYDNYLHLNDHQQRCQFRIDYDKIIDQFNGDTNLHITYDTSHDNNEEVQIDIYDKQLLLLTHNNTNNIIYLKQDTNNYYSREKDDTNVLYNFKYYLRQRQRFYTTYSLKKQFKGQLSHDNTHNYQKKNSGGKTYTQVTLNNNYSVSWKLMDTFNFAYMHYLKNYDFYEFELSFYRNSSITPNDTEEFDWYYTIIDEDKSNSDMNVQIGVRRLNGNDEGFLKVNDHIYTVDIGDYLYNEDNPIKMQIYFHDEFITVNYIFNQIDHIIESNIGNDIYNGTQQTFDNDHYYLKLNLVSQNLQNSYDYGVNFYSYDSLRNQIDINNKIMFSQLQLNNTNSTLNLSKSTQFKSESDQNIQRRQLLKTSITKDDVNLLFDKQSNVIIDFNLYANNDTIIRLNKYHAHIYIDKVFYDDNIPISNSEITILKDEDRSINSELNEFFDQSIEVKIPLERNINVYFKIVLDNVDDQTLIELLNESKIIQTIY